jgi:hypothetical protein
MNHKASATCPNGHVVEFGPCQIEVKRLFGGTKACGSKGYVELSQDAVECQGCKTVIQAKTCPVCNASIPIAAFQKKGIFAKLG